MEAIRREEVEFETIEIPVKPQHKEKWKTLWILSKPENKKFKEEEILRLEVDDRIYFTIDLLPKVSIYLAKERKERGIKIDQIGAEVEGWKFTEDIVDLLDWDWIVQEIYDFKIVKGCWNLVLDRNMLKNLLLSAKYKILALPEVLEVKSKDDVKRVEDVVLLVIKKYLDLFYRKYAKRFETENLHYATVGKQLPLFVFEKPGKKFCYTVQIDKKKKELIKEIRNLARNLDKLLKEDTKTLPRIYFDNHLYVPILLQSKRIDKISPEGLVKSESDFVTGLKDYLKLDKEKFVDYEIYLVRNFPKSGVGFQLQWVKFYPDFIMWVKNGRKQTVVFIDPHGLEHIKTLNNEKIKFAGFLDKDVEEVITIKQIEQDINKRFKKDIILESFILSPTDYEDLKKGETNFPQKVEYLKRHVLFLKDSDWPGRLFSNLITSNAQRF